MTGLLTVWVPSNHTSVPDSTGLLLVIPCLVPITTKDFFSFSNLKESMEGFTSTFIGGCFPKTTSALYVELELPTFVTVLGNSTLKGFDCITLTVIEGQLRSFGKPLLSSGQLLYVVSWNASHQCCIVTHVAQHLCVVVCWGFIR